MIQQQYVLDAGREAWAVFITPGIARHHATDPISLIRQAFTYYGLDVGEDDVKAGLGAHRFCLLIDGFDEWDAASREQFRKLTANPDYIHLPIVVSAREIFYLDLPSAERLPRTFGLLRVQPVPPAQVKVYLINRLGPEQGLADWNAIRTHRLVRIFRTPLILDKFTEKRKSGQSVPRSKIELLRGYFNDFFSTWELGKGRHYRE
ncbi:unnamed protein product, partial [marine sediment metagenome]